MHDGALTGLRREPNLIHHRPHDGDAATASGVAVRHLAVEGREVKAVALVLDADLAAGVIDFDPHLVVIINTGVLDDVRARLTEREADVLDTVVLDAEQRQCVRHRASNQRDGFNLLRKGDRDVDPHVELRDFRIVVTR
jgi:hypothetical protein